MSIFRAWVFSLSTVAAILLSAVHCPAQPAAGGFGRGTPLRGQPPGGARGPLNLQRQIQRSSGMNVVHFTCVMYALQAAPEKLAALDTKTLEANAAGTDALSKFLSGTGNSRLLYRFDQPLNVYSGQIRLGANEPYVTATEITDSGQELNRVNSLSVGAILRFSARAATNAAMGAAPEVTVNAHISELAPEDKRGAQETAEARPRGVTLEQAEPLELNRPRIMLTVSSTSGNGEPVPPMAYLVYYVFSRLPPPGVTETARNPGEAGPQPPGNSATTNLLAQFAGSNVPARFQATIYEVEAVADRVGALDSMALAKSAATDKELLKVLADAGKARILYRVDQLVNACSERMQIGANEPETTNARLSHDGQLLKAYSYRPTGATVSLSSQMIGKGAPGEGPALTFEAAVSYLVNSGVNVAPGVPAPSTRILQFEDTEALEFNRPRVFVAAGRVARDQAAPLVCVVRYMLSPPATP
jgi:hypothetical protein